MSRANGSPSRLQQPRLSVGEEVAAQRERAEVVAIWDDGFVVASPSGQHLFESCTHDGLCVGDQVLIHASVMLVGLASEESDHDPYEPVRRFSADFAKEMESVTTKPTKKPAKGKAKSTKTPKYTEEEIQCLRLTLEALPSLTSVLQTLLSLSDESDKVYKSKLQKAVGVRKWKKAIREVMKLKGCSANFRIGHLYTWHGAHPDQWAKPTDLLRSINP